MKPIPVKVNFTVGLDLLDRTIDGSEFIKSRLQDDMSREILDVVTLKANDLSGDPKGQAQSTMVMTIVTDYAELDNECRKALVITASRNVVADSFSQAAFEVLKQQVDALSQLDASSAPEFVEAFAKLKIAKVLVDFAAANATSAKQIDPEEIMGISRQEVGEMFAKSVDRCLRNG